MTASGARSQYGSRFWPMDVDPIHALAREIYFFLITVMTYSRGHKGDVLKEGAR